MVNILRALCLIAALAITGSAHAAVRILATTADWGALASELGGDKVDVYTATNALQDVHRVDAKPSLVARARNADLVVANGAELEAGWLPVLLQESGNRKVQPGTPGYFEATAQLKLIEVPTAVDRAMGDIHPQGNPHVQLDPRNIACRREGARREARCARSRERRLLRGTRTRIFRRRWQAAIARWEAEAAPLKGVPVVVMHKDQSYLCRWLGLKQLAAIEPKPGVPPSAGYLAELVTTLSSAPPRMILRNAYNDPKAANWLSERVHAPVVTLPFSVGGTPGAKDLYGLFDDSIRQLLAVPK